MTSLTKAIFSFRKLLNSFHPVQQQTTSLRFDPDLNQNFFQPATSVFPFQTQSSLTPFRLPAFSISNSLVLRSTQHSRFIKNCSLRRETQVNMPPKQDKTSTERLYGLSDAEMKTSINVLRLLAVDGNVCRPCRFSIVSLRSLHLTKSFINFRSPSIGTLWPG